MPSRVSDAPWISGARFLMVAVAVLLGDATPLVWRMLFVQLAPGIWGAGAWSAVTGDGSGSPNPSGQGRR